MLPTAARELQDKTDETVNRLNAKTAEPDTESRAVRTTLARLRTLDDGAARPSATPRQG